MYLKFIFNAVFMAEFFVLFYLVARQRKPMRFDETARPVPCSFIMPPEGIIIWRVQIVIKGLNLPPHPPDFNRVNLSSSIFKIRL